MGSKSDAIKKQALLATMLVLASAFAAMIGLSLGVGHAWADTEPGTPSLEDLGVKTYIVSFKAAAKDNGYREYRSSKAPKKKISNVKSSNPAVATAKAYKSSKYNSLDVYIKKTGTTYISYKFGGKKHTVKYVVKPYKNYVKSFKIGSKSYTSKFAPKAIEPVAGFVISGLSGHPFTGKLKVKLKSGWKIKKLWYWRDALDNPEDMEMVYVKNGGMLEKARSVLVWAKKGTQSEVFCLPS